MKRIIPHLILIKTREKQPCMLSSEPICQQLDNLYNYYMVRGAALTILDQGHPGPQSSQPLLIGTLL